MRTSHRKLADSGRLLRRSSLFACLALLLLCSSSEAQMTILTYTQANTSTPDVVTLNNNGTGSTLVTTGNADGANVSIPILITSFLGVSYAAHPIAAFETFVNVDSSGTAYSVGGTDAQAFNGKIEITSLPGGFGANYLTASFTNTDMAAGQTSVSGGNLTYAAGLSGSQPPQTLTLTSQFAPLGTPTSMSISFTNLSRSLQIYKSSLGQSGNTTMQETGLFSAAIVPEPSSFLVAGIGAFGLIGYGLRRRKALAA